MDAFIGMIITVPYMYAPQSWSYCGGQSIAVAQNQALYALLGTNYGGNTSNFNLPNLVSRVAIGSNRMGTPPAPLTPHALAATGGFETAIIAHTHPGTFNPAGVTVTLPTFTGSVTTNTTLLASSSNGSQSTPSAGSYLAGLDGNTVNGDNLPGNGPYVAGTPTSTVALGGISSTSTASLKPSGTASLSGSGALTVGANTGTANSLPPFLALSFIIALEGIFPMQPN